MVQYEKNYLGIDWGSAGVGVALAHAETGVALAYTTFRNDTHLLKKLGEIIASEEIGTIVIGIPEYIHRETEESGGEKLGKIVAQQFPIQVAYQNEMFTTKMAQANLIERGEKNVSKHDDAEAARIILQEWLDTRSGEII